ncbi:MAG: twin-arginine translocation signal domain-containing protein [Verrucomicrobiia bacterium]
MIFNIHLKEWNRRAFLKASSLIGAAGGVAIFSKNYSSNAADKSNLSITESAYDLQKLGKIDPSLIKYDQIKSIPLKDEPKRIELTDDGNIWVSTGRSIVILSQEGLVKKEYNFPDIVRCFYPSSNEQMYVGFRDFIEVWALNGTKLAKWESLGKKAWFSAIVEFNDFVFVADCGNRQVIKYDKSGKVIAKIDGKDENQKGGFVVPSPYFDIGKGGDGLLWVANPGRHRLEAYSLEGDLMKFWGKPSFSIDGFCGCCNPSYFTITKQGKFITSEKRLVRIKVYSANGEFESVVAGMEAFGEYYKNQNSDPVAVDVAADQDGKVYVADLLRKEIRIFKEKTAV